MGNRRVSIRLVAVAALVAMLAACNSDPVDKTGAPIPTHPATLRMLVPAAGDPEARFFADAVAKRSNGQLHVQIDSNTYSDSDPQQEERAAVALSHGQADLGFLAGREWAQAGDAGFAALQTPFLVTTLTAATRVTRAPVAQALLTGLSSRNVVGLALSVQEPRQLLTTRPFFGSDLAGAHIRVIDNDLTAGLIQALGGVPVQRLTARETTTLLPSGKIDGVETSPTSVLDNAYSQAAPYLSAYGLIPKINTIVASAPSWERLTDAQRDAVRAAATDTRDHAATAVPDRENRVLATLCSEGLVVDEASLSVMEALTRRATAAPTAASSVVTAIKEVVGDPGPEMDATVFPRQCQVAHDTAEAESVHRQHAPTIAHRGGSKIPPGTYVTKDTVADFQAGAVIGPDWEKDIVFSQVFYPDGRFLSTQQPDYPDEGPVHARYATRGDTVTFTFDHSTTPALSETVKWSYYNGELTFAIIDVNDSGSRVIYLAHPWRKVS
jgi:TRAP-type C4-dicarboxylate transport system substrate-binding protein